ncbi:unnamed protein product [Anisakis simplex]|uniref:STAS domain-containing protein n=1 Tax=Anisakis simplex TaxID=6269 RepID=A0A0M3JR53_ANISI|nr:unnamed protein product [Anisakis simplex]
MPKNVADSELPTHITSLRETFLRQEEFDQTYLFLPPPQVEDKKRKFILKVFHPCLSPEQFVRFIVSFIPIVGWLPDYRWKRNLMGDFMAGITVGIMHVPQGIAYAILQGVDPVYGLYSSFFPVLFYMVFGTSHHVSIGSFAIISLMTGTSRAEILETIHDEYLHDEGHYLEQVAQLGYTSVDLRNITDYVPFHLKGVSGIQVVTVITLCVGFVHVSSSLKKYLQLLMALLRVEFVTSYLSDQLVSGFSTGASVHVIIVQLDKIFQVPVDFVDVQSVNGPGGMLMQLVSVLSKVGDMNVVTFLLSMCAFIFLYIGKDCINPLFRKKFKCVPLPFELMLVTLATVVSYIFAFEQRYQMKVVGVVPVGFPSAEMPRLELIPYVYKDAFEIAFVIVAVHLSMCKVFSRRHIYSTDNNQELYAIGLTGVISSCFLTYPVSSALGRSMLMEESGGKTQLSALFSSALVLVVILWLSPYLQYLPMCILAVILIFSMKNIFRKRDELQCLWRVSKVDFAIWMFSFICTVFTNVMWGLVLSVAFALLTTVFRTQWLEDYDFCTTAELPRWHLLSRLEGTDDYRDTGRYGRVTDIDHIRIFRFDAPLLFTNVDHFRSAVEKATITCPVMSLATLDNVLEVECPNKAIRKKCAVKRTSFKRSISEYHDSAMRRIEHLIIDCSGFTFVDFMSVNSLIEIYQQTRYNGIQVYFAGAKAPIRDMFEACGFYKSVSKDHFYPSIHDAVQAANMNQQIRLFKRAKQKRVDAEVTKIENAKFLSNSCVDDRKISIECIKAQTPIENDVEEFCMQQQQQHSNERECTDRESSTDQDDPDNQNTRTTYLSDRY